MSRRLTSDSVNFRISCQIGVIRTFIGGEGASGIHPEGNLPEGGLQRQASAIFVAFAAVPLAAGNHSLVIGAEPNPEKGN